MSYKFKNEYRQGDWPIDCDICGSRVWFSDSTLLDIYTGRGGYRVCPDDIDPIDYGIVPYNIRAERPLPYAKLLQPYPLIDNFASIITEGYENNDPMNVSPQDLINEENQITWDTSQDIWDQSTKKWDGT